MTTQNKNAKIICIGWHKTGTTTLGDALLKLGYNVTGCREDLAFPLLENNMTPVFEVANQFDALQDMPWSVLYKELDHKYPGSKFILTVRDEAAWLNSIKNHFGSNYTALREWIYGNGVFEGNEALYVKKFRAHYDEVAQYFQDRPNDLIIMDLKHGDGWEKLCSFLNCPIPQSPFPHANKGKHNYDVNDKIKATLRRFLPTWIRDFRIHILTYFGFPNKKDRFKNKKHNQSARKKYNT